MASFSGFIRKSPSSILKDNFEARNAFVSENFDWTSKGRGTDLVHSVETLIAEQPDRKQDELKAE